MCNIHHMFKKNVVDMMVKVVNGMTKHTSGLLVQPYISYPLYFLFFLISGSIKSICLLLKVNGVYMIHTVRWWSFFLILCLFKHFFVPIKIGLWLICHVIVYFIVFLFTHLFPPEARMHPLYSKYNKSGHVALFDDDECMK